MHLALDESAAQLTRHAPAIYAVQVEYESLRAQHLNIMPMHFTLLRCLNSPYELCTCHSIWVICVVSESR